MPLKAASQDITGNDNGCSVGCLKDGFTLVLTEGIWSSMSSTHPEGCQAKQYPFCNHTIHILSLTLHIKTV